MGGGILIRYRQPRKPQNRSAAKWLKSYFDCWFFRPSLSKLRNNKNKTSAVIAATQAADHFNHEKEMKLKKKKEPITFQEIYEDVKNSKHPATVFVENVAAATMKTVPAVRQWIAGTRVPDELTQAAIGRLLGRDPKKLFPKK